jgi:hypothetical protein
VRLGFLPFREVIKGEPSGRKECDYGMWRFIFNLRTLGCGMERRLHNIFSETSPFGPLPSNVNVSQLSSLFVVSKDAQGQRSKDVASKMKKFFCSLTENAKFTILDNTSPPLLRL